MSRRCWNGRDRKGHIPWVYGTDVAWVMKHGLYPMLYDYCWTKIPYLTHLVAILTCLTNTVDSSCGSRIKNSFIIDDRSKRWAEICVVISNYVSCQWFAANQFTVIAVWLVTGGRTLSGTLLNNNKRKYRHRGRCQANSVKKCKDPHTLTCNGAQKKQKH